MDNIIWTKDKFPSIEEIEQVIFEERDYPKITKMKMFFEENFKELNSNGKMNFGYFLMCSKEDERGLKILRSSLEDKDGTLTEESKIFYENIEREIELLRKYTSQEISSFECSYFETAIDQFKIRLLKWGCCVLYLQSLNLLSNSSILERCGDVMNFLNYVRTTVAEYVRLDTLEFLTLEVSLLEKLFDYHSLKAKFGRIIELIPLEDPGCVRKLWYEDKRKFYQCFTSRYERLFPKKKIDVTRHFQNVRRYTGRIRSGSHLPEIHEIVITVSDSKNENKCVFLMNDEVVVFDEKREFLVPIFHVPETFRVFAKEVGGGYLVIVNPFFNSDYLLFFYGSFVRTLSWRYEIILCDHGYLVLKDDTLEVVYNGKKAGHLPYPPGFKIGEEKKEIFVLCQDFLVHRDEIKFWKQYGFSGAFLGFSSLDFSSYGGSDTNQGFRRNEQDGRVEVYYESPFTWTRIPDVFRSMNNLEPLQDFSRCLTNMAMKGVYSFNPIRNGKKCRFRDFCEPYQSFIIHLLLTFENTETEFRFIPKEIVLHEILPFLSEIGVFVTHHWEMKRFLEFSSYKALGCSPPFEERYFDCITNIEDKTSPWDILSSLVAFVQWLSCDYTSAIKLMLERVEISYSFEEVFFGPTLPKLAQHLFVTNQDTSYVFRELRVQMFTFLNLIVEYVNTSFAVSFISNPSFQSTDQLWQGKPENCSFNISPFLEVLTYIMERYLEMESSEEGSLQNQNHYRFFIDADSTLKNFLNFIVSSVRSKAPEVGLDEIGVGLSALPESSDMVLKNGLFEVNPTPRTALSVDIRLIDLLSKLSCSESLMERIDGASAINIMSTFEAFFETNAKCWQLYNFCDEKHEEIRGRCRQIFECLHYWYQQNVRNSSTITSTILNLILKQFCKFNPSFLEFMCECLYSKTPSPFFPEVVGDDRGPTGPFIRISIECLSLCYDFLIWMTKSLPDKRFLLSSLSFFKILKAGRKVPSELTFLFFERLYKVDNSKLYFRVLLESDFDSLLHRNLWKYDHFSSDVLFNMKLLNDTLNSSSTVLMITERLDEISDSSALYCFLFALGGVEKFCQEFNFENMALKSEIVSKMDGVLNRMKKFLPYVFGEKVEITSGDHQQEFKRARSRYETYSKGPGGLFVKLSHAVLDVTSNIEHYRKDINNLYNSLKNIFEAVFEKSRSATDEDDIKKILAEGINNSPWSSILVAFGILMFYVDYVLENEESSLSKDFSEDSIKGISLLIMVAPRITRLFEESGFFSRTLTYFIIKHKDFLVLDPQFLSEFMRALIDKLKISIEEKRVLLSDEIEYFLALSHFPIESREFACVLLSLVDNESLWKIKVNDLGPLAREYWKNMPEIETTFKMLFWKIFTKLNDEDSIFVTKEIIRYSVSSWFSLEKYLNRVFLPCDILGKISNSDFFIDNLSLEECKGLCVSLVSLSNIFKVSLFSDQNIVLDVLKTMKSLLFHPKYSTVIATEVLNEEAIKSICSFGFLQRKFRLKRGDEEKKRIYRHSFLVTARIIHGLFKDVPKAREFFIPVLKDTILIGFQRAKSFCFSGENYVGELAYRTRQVVNKSGKRIGAISFPETDIGTTGEYNSIEYFNVCQDFLVLVMDYLERERGEEYLENFLVTSGELLDLVTNSIGREIEIIEDPSWKKPTVLKYLKRGIFLRVLQKIRGNLPQYIKDDPRVGIKKEVEEEEGEEDEVENDKHKFDGDKEFGVKRLRRSNFFDFDAKVKQVEGVMGVEKLERRRQKRRNHPRKMESRSDVGANWNFDFNSDKKHPASDTKKENEEGSFSFDLADQPSLIQSKEETKSMFEKKETEEFNFDDKKEKNEKNQSEKVFSGFGDLDFKFDESSLPTQESSVFQPDISKDDQPFSLDIDFSETTNKDGDNKEEGEGKSESLGGLDLDFESKDKGGDRNEIFFF